MRKKKNLEKLTAKWQKILRLQDWDIQVSYGGSKELIDDLHGLCHSDQTYKKAAIIISDGSNIVTDLVKFDDELTLIHELLHLVFEPPNKKNQDSYERAIEQTAAALVALDKASKKHV